MSPTATSAGLLLGTVLATTVGLMRTGAPLAIAWLAPINVATLAVWAWDKHQAVRDRRRVPEAALIALAILGGAIGAAIGVFGLRHKSRTPKFSLGIPAIIALQVALAIVIAR